MANSKQAIKRARQADSRSQRNASLRSTMRTEIKKLLKALQAQDNTLAQGCFKATCQLIDRISGKGLIHKNKAARLKQRLNTKLKALA